MVAILSYPNKRLNNKARTVEDVLAPDVQAVIKDMFETLYSTENCAGLAATQLDFEEPLAITVIDVSEEKDQPYCLINPEIIASEGETNEPEACMSVYPSYVSDSVKRAEKITVRYLNQQGEQVELAADGFLAKCIQHEIDHLNGYLYIDRLSKLKRSRADKKIAKVRRFLESE
ncbi:MAG: peptide deformylase [Legionellales bacterium]|nr:peptide deformylase [Legionellales bacterium]|tara:strand:- start:25852 stop:26373 length:522 start_codon:yes stop_codon:yes gene_type:complete